MISFRVGILVLLPSVLLPASAGPVAVFAPGRTGSAIASREIGFAERVAAQKAIEEVYWRHRAWPDANPHPKPLLSTVVSNQELRSRVEDYLRKSSALELWWQRPVAAEQLQAELDRMSAGTRDPKMLRELHAALGNDPLLIAETLARQTLADRLIRDWYASDGRFSEQNGAQRRRSFEEWWSVARESANADVASERGPFSLAAPPNKACADDTWQRRFRAPLAMSPHVAVWTGTEMIAWGAWAEQSTILTGARYNPATNTWLPTSPSPSEPRLDGSRPTAVWTGSEMIVWGGVDGTGGRYSPATNTWTPTSSEDAPSARKDHTAVWTGREMIIWGGSGTNTGGRYDPATDTWLPTSTIPSTIPQGRSGHTAVWTGEAMIVWGGFRGGPLNTGGQYYPATNSWWRTSLGDAPAAREGHTAVWTGSEMIVWGGVSNNTGGRYDPTTDRWRPMPGGANVPAPREYHTAVWTGEEMIVWGGDLRYASSSQGMRGYDPSTNTGGRYDPSTDTWRATSTDAGVPSGRSRHSALWTGTEMIVWGGPWSNTGGRYDPTTDTWVATYAADETPLVWNPAVWTGAEMIVWGDTEYGGGPVGEGARYRPATDTWTPTSTGPNTPAATWGHTLVWTGSEMIVWGGSSADPEVGYAVVGGRYDPSTDTWEGTSSEGEVPAGRTGHTAMWTGSEMIVWGGRTGAFTLWNTGGRYDPSTDRWRSTSADPGVPEGREQHTAVWTGEEMIVWGGLHFEEYYDSFRWLASGGRYDPSTDRWTATSEAGAPAGRTAHTGVWTGEEMVVWGGFYREDNAQHQLPLGGRYDPATDRWTATSVAPHAPEGVWGHSAVWTGEEMIVWGGQTPHRINRGGRYVPATNTWRETSLGSNVPPPRARHIAQWSGSEMIVWGTEFGLDPNVYFYCVCTDPDHDDVCTAEDPFPSSDPRPTVAIGECDSGVANEFVSSGANMNDLIGECEASASSPGDFVSCVAQLTNEWHAAGWIDGREKSRVQRCASQSAQVPTPGTRFHPKS